MCGTNNIEKGIVPEGKAQDFSDKKYLYFMRADTELDKRGYIGIITLLMPLITLIPSCDLCCNEKELKNERYMCGEVS